ncbi:MAG TPA: hypothetical protein EYQ60_19355 [Myxococcales bacterium]|nr:hypothetical protein [Myxococcales bacterium]
MSLAELGKGVHAFNLRCWKIEIRSAFAVILTTTIYLIAFLHLDIAESLALAGCFLAWLILGGLASEIVRRLRSDSIKRFLNHEENVESGEAGRREASAAHAAIVSLPGWMQKALLLQGIMSMVCVPAMMWVLGFGSWFEFRRLGTFATTALTVSLLGGLLTYYWARRGLAPWRVDVARRARCGDIEISGAPAPSLNTRMLAAILIPSIAGMALVFDVMSRTASEGSVETAREWVVEAVEAVAAAPQDLLLVDRVSSQLPAENFWPAPIEILEFRDNRIDLSGASKPLSAGLRAQLDQALRMGKVSGIVGSAPTEEIGAFKKLDDGMILVAFVLRSDLESGLAGFDAGLGVVLLSLIVVAVTTARFVAAELDRNAEGLRATAARLAAGDLRPNVDDESIESLDGVGRELERVRHSIQTMASRISNTITGVDEIAREMALVAGQVLASSSDQGQRLQQANQVLSGLGDRCGDVRGTAVNLTSTIDESNGAVIELGAAGSELNETASALSIRVDAVSGSLEQMVRSVQQVSGISDRLAEASEETSSSMEEMASSMRAVDTSAETTASLSRDVVRIAEIGQAKVVQTIAGMEAIRQATDAAESVIRGLAARTKEIGGILDVIDDVADETNLLALNAAIIAAQAGDQGKAFSVVADEIKDLADRVLANTKEIGGLIHAVQDESENAIGAIEAGSVSVMSGVDLSAEAGRTLGEITVASRESGTRIGEIVASVREQTKAASHVASLMERVNESAEEIGLAGGEQGRGNEIVFEAVLGMREVAQQVRRTTEDQAAGIGRIQMNVDEMRDAVGRITGSLGQQSEACSQMSEVLSRVSEETETNEGAAEKLQAVTRELIAHSDSLREESERFRV